MRWHRAVGKAIGSTFAKKWRTNMYPQRYPSNMSQFSSQQLVSLEKHQEMIDSALCWHKYAHSVPVGQERTSVAKLRRIVATIVSIFQW